MPDWIRLSIGTLSIFRVRPPNTVDSPTAGRAMLAAPAVGLLLAIPASLLISALTWLTKPGALVALLIAALTVSLLAWLTRAMHLYGLADTADALGSGKSAAAALDIMRKSDIGPFGVVTLVATLFIEVTALALAIAAGRGVVAIAIALVISRVALPLACRSGIPAARPTGLGSTVAGSVAPLAALLAAAGSVAVVALVGIVTVDLREGMIWAGFSIVALAISVWFTQRCVRRFGGITGDVLGALVEITFAATLVGFALAA